MSTKFIDVEPFASGLAGRAILPGGRAYRETANSKAMCIVML